MTPTLADRGRVLAVAVVYAAVLALGVGLGLGLGASAPPSPRAVHAPSVQPQPVLPSPSPPTPAPTPAARGVEQVEHVVIFIQENRAFDHYIGMLDGVRGFNDRAQVVLPSGLPALYQPTNAATPGLDCLLPYPALTHTTSSLCMEAPLMTYAADLGVFDAGRMDAWNTARPAGHGQSFMTRDDLPYYYALYDGFTAGDQYFQSALAQTNPNRMHAFTGSNGLSVGLPAVMNNAEPTPGYSWITMGEVLEAANVSWRVYQETDNYDDNGFAYFQSFMASVPGEPLWDKGMARVNNLIDAFDADLAAGTLPQVSWIVARQNVSEHAKMMPTAGEDYTAQILARLAANPAVYAKTAFLLTYDEGGQFVDHAVPPSPPMSESTGASTVSTVGEVTPQLQPIGLGFRVPLVVISPWSRGHRVVSEVFDHTSIVRFIEARFNVSCPNISPWRRAMTGDLTAAFDFTSFDASWPALPDTSGNVAIGEAACKTLPPLHAPVNQTRPRQEPGTRLALPLHYALLVTDAVSPNGLVLTIANAGAAGAPLHAYDALHGAATLPHMYAVAAGTSVTDTLPLQPGAVPGAYLFALHGPNGFVRSFAGNATSALGTAVSAFVTYERHGTPDARLVVNIAASNTKAAANYTIVDNAYGGAPTAGALLPGAAAAVRRVLDVSSSGHWYDLTVSVTPASSAEVVLQRRFMGHVETGRMSTSDPAMAAGVAGFADDVAAQRGALLGGSIVLTLHASTSNSRYGIITRVPVGSGFRLDAFHVWGSQVVFSRETGVYTMAASIYPVALPFYSSWLYVAQIASATSRTPLGPFAMGSIVLPYGAADAWDRSVMNPKLLRAPGEPSLWLLFYTGSSYTGPTPGGGVPLPTNQTLAQASQRVGVATAPLPGGPFTRFGAPVLSPRPSAWDSRIISNPAIVAFGGAGADATALLVVYKASSPVYGKQTRVCFGAARAAAWNQPFVRVSDEPILPCPDDSFYAEDPTLWRDPTGVFHLVFKDFQGHYTGAGYSGAHATSSDGGVTWLVTRPALAYTTTHVWSDGVTRKQRAQERVQILLNETLDGGDGAPLAVFYATDTELDDSSRFWNMAVPLRASALL